MVHKYRVLESKCRQKNLNFFVCMIARIIWMVLIDHKFDTVLTDIEVGLVFEMLAKKMDVYFEWFCDCLVSESDFS